MDLNKLLEALIANTAALTAHTAALGGAAAGTKPAAAAAASTAKPGAKPAAKKGATKEQMTTALNELKEKFGADEAKTIIKDVGGVEKLGQMPDDKVDEVCKAAVARLAELEAAPAAGAEDDDGL